MIRGLSENISVSVYIGIDSDDAFFVPTSTTASCHAPIPLTSEGLKIINQLFKDSILPFSMPFSMPYSFKYENNARSI